MLRWQLDTKEGIIWELKTSKVTAPLPFTKIQAGDQGKDQECGRLAKVNLSRIRTNVLYIPHPTNYH